MTYVPNQPQDLPSPSVAVNQIRNNFSTYATVFDNNHQALNASEQGKHTNVIIQGQIRHPIVNDNFNALYSFGVTSNSSSSQELFLRIPQFLPNQQPNDPIQLTFNSVNTAGPNYQSFMAGGYLLFFGQTSNIALPITLTPAPKEILCVIANYNNSVTIPAKVSVNVISNTQFKINSTAVGVYTFSWFAICKQ